MKSILIIVVHKIHTKDLIEFLPKLYYES